MQFERVVIEVTKYLAKKHYEWVDGADIAAHLTKTDPNKLYGDKHYNNQIEKMEKEANGRFFSRNLSYTEETPYGKEQRVKKQYMLAPSKKKAQLIQALARLEEQFDEIANDNILTLSDADIETLKKIPQLKQMIAELMKQ